MDYEYYDYSIESYNLEDDVGYGLDEDDQAHTHSDNFYDEIENISSSPSPNWHPQEMQSHQGHRTFTNSQNLSLPRQYTGSASGRYEKRTNPMYLDRMSRQNHMESLQSNNHLNVAPKATHNHQMPNLSQPRAISSNPRNTHGIRLRPVSDLPDMYRGIFKFGVFNAVQSTCFDTITNGNENLIVSAPTGSGKTVLFELGIIHTMSQNMSTAKKVKCVYIAPTKALCSERFRDWTAKFEPLGMKCCELTGDTAVFGNNTWGDTKNASIIITTCEKWDSLTRNWHDHHQILCQIQLFMVDEVHILNESRGSTLEVVTSRMKFHGSEVRFILVSATVPNTEDIAAWIGSGVTESEPAHVYEFGDDYRPCKLIRHVVGIPRRNGQNDFQFAKILDFKLFSIIQQHSVGKPTLIFCSTRKGVFGTAEQLMKEFAENEANKKSLPWARPPRTDYAFVDKRLDELATFGIGVHHAGLSMEDRRATEDLYLKKLIRVLVATSTLAVGVNLPAHMVIIKGVKTFQNNASVEYSDLDIMQMLGRAGRPQFDKDGIAVIMCEIELEQKYKTLVQGKTILESSLHINLAEHLNSEIGLGTIRDMNTAKDWLRASFLYQRMQSNPGYYALSLEDKKTIRESVDDLVMQSIGQLKKAELVNYVEGGGNNGTLTSTGYGEIMSKFYIRRATMELILSLPEQASLREILEVISAAEELQEVKLRASEKTVYNKLRRDIDIRYEIKKVEKTSDKVFLLIQSVLGGISLNSPEYKTADSQPYMEAFTIFKHVARISRAVVEVAICKKFGSQVKYGLELSRCLTAKAWEDRAVVLRQIEQIGEKSIKVLAEHGITSFDILREQNPFRIETLLNRRSPFGLDVLASVAELPQYSLSVKKTEVFSDGGMNPVQVHLLVECGLVNEVSASTKKKRSRAMNITVVLTLTSDMDLIDFRRIPTKALTNGKSFEVIAELTKPSQTIIVIITSESTAGVTLTQTYKPNVVANEYPVLDTRPLSCVEQDLVGLEDDPDFWNMDIDSQTTDTPPKRSDKTADTAKKTSKRTSQEAAKELNYDPVSLEAKRRPNGTYDCNHRCKDKSNCRHMCCREGLAQGPPVKFNHQLSGDPLPKPKAPSSLQRLHPTNKGPPSADRKMKELKFIHERTHVSQNIKLSDGGRLLPQPKRKRQIGSDFDIQFTDLKNPELDDASDSNGMTCDSDDLPEAVLPVIGKKDIPWTGLPQSGMAATSSKVTKTDKTINSKPVLSSRTTNFDRVEGQPTKRVRTANSSAGNEKNIEAALFLEPSDDENCIEIVPSPRLSQKVGPPRRNMSMASSSIQSSNKFKYSMSPTLSSSSFGRDLSLPTKSGHLETYKIKEAAETVYDSEFAELDAWLQSGSSQVL